MPKIEAANSQQQRQAPECPQDIPYWLAVLTTLYRSGALNDAPPMIKQRIIVSSHRAAG
jgi:hypothetical protein